MRHGRTWRTRPPAGAAERPPLVLAETVAGARRLSACCGKATALGLVPGLGLAAARAMHPEIEVLQADPAADTRFLKHLAQWATRYTPLAGLDGSDGLFLDIAGCAHLFGGEEALMLDACLGIIGNRPKVIPNCQIWKYNVIKSLRLPA